MNSFSRRQKNRHTTLQDAELGALRNHTHITDSRFTDFATFTLQKAAQTQLCLRACETTVSGCI